jgi:hypothetical protein
VSHWVDPDAYDYSSQIERIISPQARKVHTCEACGEKVYQGQHYIRETIIAEGSADSVKRCLRCQAIYEHLMMSMPGDNDVPDRRLNCGHTYEEVHGEPPPLDIAALAFMLPHEYEELFDFTKNDLSTQKN